MTSFISGRRCAVLFLVGALAFVGFLGVRAASGTSIADAGSNAKVKVTIERFAYDPSPLRVDPGTKIVFDDEDGSITHTATAKNGSFDTGDIKVGTTKSIVLRKPGVYKYYCTIHPFMHGKIVVK
jgi:plastocyanin